MGQITCPDAFLSFSAVSVQTAAVLQLPAVVGSLFYAAFLTAPVVISEPAGILCQFQYSELAYALLSAPSWVFGSLPLQQLPQPDYLPAL